MATLDDVILAHREAIIAAIVSAGAPTNGDITDEPPDENTLLERVLKGGGYIVSVAPNTVSSQITRYAPVTLYPTYAPTVTASLSGSTITIGGAAGPEPCTVYVIAGPQQRAAAVTIATADDYAWAPANLAAQITVKCGVSAAATLQSVFVNGPVSFVTVSTQATAQITVAKVSERLQVTIWTQDGATRSAIVNAIMANVGTPLNRSLDTSGGDGCYTMFVSGPRRVTEPVSDGMLRRADLFFDTEYDLTVNAPSSSIGLGDATSIVTTEAGAVITVDSTTEYVG